MPSKQSQPKTVAVPEKKDRYFEGVGGRKTAVARVRVFAGQGPMVINGKSIKEYFQSPVHQDIAVASLKLTSMLDAVMVSVKVRGGGIAAQSEAVRHGIAQALVKMKEDFKKSLRAAGFLTRDPRVVERKKPGLKKARKAPQWAKR